MASQENTLVLGSRRVDVLQSSVGWILKNHIGTRREFRIFYRKGIGVLLKIISSNIKKKGLKIKKLVKSNG